MSTRQKTRSTSTSPDVHQLLEQVKQLTLENSTLRTYITDRGLPDPLNKLLLNENSRNSITRSRAKNPSNVERLLATPKTPMSPKAGNRGCACKGNCSNRICGCVKKHIACTELCKCGEGVCENKEVDKENREDLNKEKSISPRPSNKRVVQFVKPRSIFSPDVANLNNGEPQSLNMSLRFGEDSEGEASNNADETSEKNEEDKRKMTKKGTKVSPLPNAENRSRRENLTVPESRRKVRSLSDNEPPSEESRRVKKTMTRRSASMEPRNVRSTKTLAGMINGPRKTLRRRNTAKAGTMGLDSDTVSVNEDRNEQRMERKKNAGKKTTEVKKKEKSKGAMKETKNSQAKGDHNIGENLIDAPEVPAQSGSRSRQMKKKPETNMRKNVTIKRVNSEASTESDEENLIDAPMMNKPETNMRKNVVTKPSNSEASTESDEENLIDAPMMNKPKTNVRKNVVTKPNDSEASTESDGEPPVKIESNEDDGDSDDPGDRDDFPIFQNPEPNLSTSYSTGLTADNGSTIDAAYEEFNPMKPRRQLSRSPIVPHTPKRQFHHPLDLSEIPLRVPFEEEPVVELPPPEELKEAVVDWEKHKAELVQCRKCGRGFYRHRIVKHETFCHNT